MSFSHPTLYWTILSQPSRAVYQFLSHELTIETTLINVDLREKKHKQPEYLAINPSGQVPALVEGDFRLAESSAILQYLATKYTATEWIPSNLKEKAIQDQYLHFHPSLRKVLAPIFVWSRLVKDEAKVAEQLESLPTVLKQVERYLAVHKYVATDAHPSIADIQLFHELVQVVELGLVDISSAPKTAAWYQNFRARPASAAVLAELKAVTDSLPAPKERKPTAAAAATEEKTR